MNGNDRKDIVNTGLEFSLNLSPVLLPLPGGGDVDTLEYVSKQPVCNGISTLNEAGQIETTHINDLSNWGCLLKSGVYKSMHNHQFHLLI
jgi:hypothetical protein